MKTLIMQIRTCSMKNHMRRDHAFARPVMILCFQHMVVCKKKPGGHIRHKIFICLKFWYYKCIYILKILDGPPAGEAHPALLPLVSSRCGSRHLPVLLTSIVKNLMSTLTDVPIKLLETLMHDHLFYWTRNSTNQIKTPYGDPKAISSPLVSSANFTSRSRVTSVSRVLCKSTTSPKGYEIYKFPVLWLVFRILCS